MAKAVILNDSNGEEVYPVTDISLVNGELNGAKIVNASVGSDKLTPNAVWNENIKDGAVTSNKIDFTTVGGIKKLLTVPYTSFGIAESSAYYFDIKSAFCDYNSNRLVVYDALLIQLDFQSQAGDPVLYLRWGPKDTPANATCRKMFTLSNNSINFQSSDAPNLIFTSNNELQETLIITPASYRSIIREKTIDEILNFAVSHHSGVQTALQDYRLHFGSWLRIQNMPQSKVPMFFDSTMPERGNMVVYGLRYPS